jgi:[ribosomal protein S18]-alanine N-acetyltransferase
VSSIRVARPTDLDPLVVLESRLFGDGAWSPRSLEAEFEALGESGFIVVAEDEDEAFGRDVVVVAYAVGWYVGEVADVQRVAVVPDCRRRGLATGLLHELIDEAGRRGCARMMLEVAADNAPAIALYSSAGFEAIDRRPRYYPGDVDALVMSRGFASP